MVIKILFFDIEKFYFDFSAINLVGVGSVYCIYVTVIASAV